MTLPPLTSGGWLTSWTLNLPVIVAVMLVSVGYLRARAQVLEWPASRTMTFLVGMAGVLLVKSSFLANYDHTLFWALAVEDVLLLSLMPAALVLGHPIELLRAALNRQPSQRSGSPLLGSLIAMITLLAVYASNWDLLRLEHRWLFEITHLLLLLVGCTFLGPLLGDNGPSYGSRTLVAFLDGLLDAVPGLAVLGTHSVIAGVWYAAHPRRWGPSLAEDQRIGGTAMIALSELVGLPALLVLLVKWVRADSFEAAAVDAKLDLVSEAEQAADGHLLLKPWWERDAGPLADRIARQDWKAD